jgi:uncharacterized membrane protein
MEIGMRQNLKSQSWKVAAASLAMLALAAGPAVMTTVTPAQAQGNACVASCKASHNQCRVATKGNASCDAQLQACLQTCIKQ